MSNILEGGYNVICCLGGYPSTRVQSRVALGSLTQDFQAGCPVYHDFYDELFRLKKASFRDILALHVCVQKQLIRQHRFFYSRREIYFHLYILGGFLLDGDLFGIHRLFGFVLRVGAKYSKYIHRYTQTSWKAKQTHIGLLVDKGCKSLFLSPCRT